MKTDCLITRKTRFKKKKKKLDSMWISRKKVIHSLLAMSTFKLQIEMKKLLM